ncbi:phosphotransferase [Yoonia sp. SS1-5]|uniref:Aminoglycoside phosphotransferase family protein n=1 Tax=Yoonia rhodophyticola TaxID=3137370 RepID=A0AAN0MAP6_9RHOB
MSDRDALQSSFLAQTTYADWIRSPLAGDASARRYVRLSKGDKTVILMDAPPENGEDTRPFQTVAAALTDDGLAAPDILVHDPKNGFMILGDLGRNDFATWLITHPGDSVTLYRAAADVAIRLNGRTLLPGLKRMTPETGAEMIELLHPHYTTMPIADLTNQMEAALATWAPEPDTMALRDYHAENLIWRPDQTGLDRVGLLDFQDAFMAPAGYDLASLLRDARRDIEPSLASEIAAYFSDQTRQPDGFRTTLSCLAVQRNLRILAVFSRLAKARNKPRYLSFLPRVWAYLMDDLADPALKDLRAATLDCLQPPSKSQRP